MSVVAIPFRTEDPGVIQANLRVAASHSRVSEVWAVHTSQSDLGWADRLDVPTMVRFVPDQRIGNKRPGKGDGMNTALRMAAEEGVGRLHFYDADITNFSTDWIEGAESAADEGFEVVRHRFPRAATDAMITWFVTRPGFALKYPDSMLSHIGQPLGGELLLDKRAISDLARNRHVTERSDWGIDTALTFWSVAAGHSLYEHQVADGKRHALYGSLEELRDMAIECLDTLRSLPRLEIPWVKHHAEPDEPVPADLATQIGYSVESTVPLLGSPWREGEESAIEILPGGMRNQALSLRQSGDFMFLDAEGWGRILNAFLDPAVADSVGADDLFFRLWVGRVLNYTSTVVEPSGYEASMDYLKRTIDAYRSSAASGDSSD